MNDSNHLPPSALEDWLAAASTELGLDPDDVPIAKVLDIARDVARGVARPAAPLTTFLVGLAVGRGAAGSFDDASATVTNLASNWANEQS